VLRTLERCLEEISDRVTREGNRIVVLGIGPSPRTRNYRDMTVLEVEGQPRETVIHADVNFQASALLGPEGQNEAVHAKLNYAFQQMRFMLGVASRPAIAPELGQTNGQAAQKHSTSAYEPAQAAAEPFRYQAASVNPVVREGASGRDVSVRDASVREAAVSEAAVPVLAALPADAAIGEIRIREISPAPAASGQEAAGAVAAPEQPIARPEQPIIQPKQPIVQPVQLLLPHEQTHAPAASVTEEPTLPLRHTRTTIGAAVAASQSIPAATAQSNAATASQSRLDTPVNLPQRRVNADDRQRSRSPLWTILALVLLGLGGLGAYLEHTGRLNEQYLTQVEDEVMARLNPGDEIAGSAPAAKPDHAAVTAQPADSAQTAPAASTDAVTEPSVAHHKEADPVDFLNSWADAMRGRDAELQASFYASPLARYQEQTNLDHDALVGLFSDNIHSRPGLWTFKIDRFATEQKEPDYWRLRLTKHFIQMGDGSNITEHPVRTRMELRRIDGEWRITSEKDFPEGAAT